MNKLKKKDLKSGGRGEKKGLFGLWPIFVWPVKSLALYRKMFTNPVILASVKSCSMKKTHFRSTVHSGS